MGGGGGECGYKPLYTPCPAPESKRRVPALLARRSRFFRSKPQGKRRSRLRLRWKYLNNYGGVPERDDIRLNIAVRQRALSYGCVPSSANDYPSAMRPRTQKRPLSTPPSSSPVRPRFPEHSYLGIYGGPNRPIYLAQALRATFARRLQSAAPHPYCPETVLFRSKQHCV